MFNETLGTALINMAPFWSIEIIKSFGLESNYNMGITMILSELIKYIMHHITDVHSFGLIITVIFVCLIKKLKLLNMDFNFLNRKTEMIFCGTEFCEKDNIRYDYSNTMKAINHIIINKYKIKKIKYFDDSIENCVIDNIEDFKIKNDLYISVRRIPLNQDKTIFSVRFILGTYKLNLHTILAEFVQTYAEINKNTYIITMVGKESVDNILYSEPMIALTYMLIHKYGFNKLRCYDNNTKSNIFTLQNSDEKTTEKTNTKKSQNVLSLLKTIKEKSEINKSSKSSDSNDSKPKYFYTVENVKNHKLTDDIYITVERKNENVSYILVSNKTNIQEFLDKTYEEYTNIIKKSPFKYKLVISGKEISKNYHEVNVNYPLPAMAINHYLIQKYDITQLKYTNTNIRYGYSNDNLKSDSEAEYMVDDLNDFKCDDDLYITINRDDDTNTADYATRVETIEYILQSNTINLTEFLENAIEKYIKYKERKFNNKLYHFVYNGMSNEGVLQFSKSLLSTISDTSDKLYETFDTMRNEHIDRIKSDINRLNNIEYHKKTGHKRKKGYCFYGEPGTGKTMTLQACALYSNRHIIQFDFNTIKTNEEFNKLLSVDDILGVRINKDKVIYACDECEDGLAKFTRNKNPENTTKPSAMDHLCTAILEKDKTISNLLNNEVSGSSINTSSPLNIGTILSKLDGIGNYNGMIIIFMTNFIDKLDDALLRDGRLTPIKFQKLRKIDVIELLEHQFDIELTDEQKEKIADRYITPAKFSVKSEQYTVYTIDNFINDHLSQIKSDYTQ
jgi:uncharacterized CHY-type Zn-finger protein